VFIQHLNHYFEEEEEEEEEEEVSLGVIMTHRNQVSYFIVHVNFKLCLSVSFI
jgi:hypothetical protein